jgi:hypothetical protein
MLPVFAAAGSSDRGLQIPRKVPAAIENRGKSLLSPWLDNSSFTKVDHKTVILFVDG